MSAKTALRKIVKAQVKALSPEERTALSLQVLKQVETHPRFAEAHTVLLYYSLPDEVDTHDFVNKWAGSKTILLPVVKGDDLELRQYTPGGELYESDFHIGAPTGDAFAAWSEIDLVLVPGVAFDKSGHRMGRGRGYYDRFLSRPELATAYKLGVCYPCQMVGAVPVDAHDVPMDNVLCG